MIKTKAKKILIMGLPGSGKTTIAKLLVPMFNAVWLNADKVRSKYKDVRQMPMRVGKSLPRFSR